MAPGFSTILSAIAVLSLISRTKGCQFYPIGEYLRFVRVPENLPVGGEVLQVDVHPRRNLILQPVDKIDDVDFFKYRTVNKTTISIRLVKSLEDLVDSATPQNVLKFRMVCEYDDGSDTISSYLSVTVYVEDVNDHEPEFIDAPYKVAVDELTPTGITIFKGIQAIDRDKPNTPNSDVQYSILDGNEHGKFALESSHRAAVVLRKPLDYDTGDHQFILTLMASDRGSPPRNSTTTLIVTVNDNDDLNPKFTKDVYRVQIPEFYPITGRRIHQEIKFEPPIHAEDQDRAINASIRYDLIAGNDRHLFSLDLKNGSLFLEKELDVDSLPGSTFTLQIQASQMDNPLKAGIARVEVELLDINDNQPQFEVDVYNISIVENLPNGFSVLQVVATDQDQGDNGEFIYHLVDPSQAFSIDSHSGWLTVRNQAKLDRETKPSLGMRVYAREKLPSVVSSNSEGDSFVSVEVTLLDANDNNPVFVPTNLYEFSVPSNAPIGQVVGRVEARDPDLGRNGMVLYDLQRGNLSSTSKPLLFSVDAQSGKISVADSPLPPGRHAQFVEASDQPVNPSERRYSLAVVTIEVTASAGDGSKVPDFIGAPYEFWVGSDVPIGTSVGQIRLNNAIDHNKVIYDLLHSYHEGVPFAVEERSGTITVIDEMRKFGRTLYDFEAVVADEKENTLATNVTIHIVESESGVPFSRTSTEPITMEFKVRENLSGALVGQLVKGGGRSKIDRFGNKTSESTRWRNQRFIIASQPDVLEQFAISQDGTIYTQKGLDRETKDTYQLTIIGENGNGIVRGGEIYQVKVHVEDENDNPPMFDRQWYKGSVKENVIALSEVKMEEPIKAKDADINGNAQFKMSLRGEGSELFILDQTTGNLLVKSDASLDREMKDSYTLRIIARDKGNLSSEARVTISIEDVNDNAPRFVQMIVHQREGVDVIKTTSDGTNNLNVVSGNSTVLKSRKNLFKEPSVPVVLIPENIPVGTNLLKLNAVDKDTGENALITYSINSETVTSDGAIPMKKHLAHFTIHPATGELSIASFLPPETEFRLNISATDSGDLSGHTIIKIYVKDVNDNAPVFTKPWYDFTIPEGTYTNHLLGHVAATDADFGENANVTYAILQKHESGAALPFAITSAGGILINGELDRETTPSFLLRVIAQDNGPLNTRLRTTVDVEVHVADINDNPPVFYSYDRLLKIPASELVDIEALPKLDEKLEGLATVPVYYASIVENSTPGVPIARVFANDSDFAGNGNGLILFDIARSRGRVGKDLFSIDSKEGVISTTAPLDFEAARTHNVTVVASDLGKPSLSATALLVVNVIDVPEPLPDDQGPMFAHRYYELEVEENCAVPLEILALNVSAEHRDKLVGAGGLRFSIVQEESSGFFHVDPRNGSLYLINSPDREKTAELVVRVRVDRITKRGKTLHMIYPIQPDALADIAPNEVKVIVKIIDVNDNSPRFIGNGRPLVAAIPTTASYGYPIVRLQAKDLDQGANGEVRYQILGQEEAKKFAVDPITGQIRSVASFVRDAGRVFGFDVKAVDRNGAEDGRSAIANVFVFVLDEQKKLAMVIEARPMEIEERMENITIALSNITNYDVRVRKLEPRLDTHPEDPIATDLYLYAVDPLMNTIVDNDLLSNALMTKEKEVRLALDPYNIMEIATVSPIVSTAESIPKPQRPILTGLEIMTIILGCIVFVGALTAAVCVGCIHRKDKNVKSSTFASNSMAEIAFGLSPKQGHIMNCKPRSMFHPHPSSFMEDSTDSYTEMASECHRHRHRQHHRHEPTCARHQSRRRKSSLTRSPSTAMLEASLASLHSSGRDSGLGKNMGRCPCGHSATHSSANSSNGSYEDSLKSLNRQHSHSSGSGGGCSHDRSHDRSLMRRQHQYNTPSLTRRPSERILVCPINN